MKRLLRVLTILIALVMTGIPAMALEYPAQVYGPYYVGSKVYVGQGAPSNALGLAGDMYIDNTTGATALYNRTSTGWQWLANLQGQMNQTANMTAGPTGPPGSGGNASVVYSAGTSTPGLIAIYNDSLQQWISPSGTTLGDLATVINLFSNISASDARMAQNLTEAKRYTDSNATKWSINTSYELISNASSQYVRAPAGTVTDQIIAVFDGVGAHLLAAGTYTINGLRDYILSIVDSHISTNATATQAAAVSIADSHIATNLTVNNTLETKANASSQFILAPAGTVTDQIIAVFSGTGAHLLAAGTYSINGLRDYILSISDAHQQQNRTDLISIGNNNASLMVAANRTSDILNQSQQYIRAPTGTSTAGGVLTWADTGAHLVATDTGILLSSLQTTAAALLARSQIEAEILFNRTALENMIWGNRTALEQNITALRGAMGNISFMAQSGWCDNSGGCTLEAPNSTYTTIGPITWIGLKFPAPTGPAGVNATWELLMPGNYDGGTMYFNLTTVQTSGDTGTVIWDVRGTCPANYGGGSMNAAWGTNVSGATLGTGTYIMNGTLRIGPVTLGGSPRAGALCFYQLRRLGGTMTDAQYILGMQGQFNVVPN